MNEATSKGSRMAKLLFLLASFLIAVPILCITGYLVWNSYRNWRKDQNWQEHLSTPLPDEIVDDLCNRDLVPSDIANCQASEIVIPYREVPNILQANLAPGSTFQDVNAIIGQYEDYCERRTELGWNDRFYCNYWIGAYPVRIVFERDTDKILTIDWYTPDRS